MIKKPIKLLYLFLIALGYACCPSLQAAAPKKKPKDLGNESIQINLVDQFLDDLDSYSHADVEVKREAVLQLVKDEQTKSKKIEEAYQQYTLAHLAAENNDFDLMQALLARADISATFFNQKDKKKKWTPLHYACYYDHDKIAKLLLYQNQGKQDKKHKIPINPVSSADNNYQTPLHIAALNGSEGVLGEFQMYHEANTNKEFTKLYVGKQADDKKTAYDYYTEQGGNKVQLKTFLASYDTKKLADTSVTIDTTSAQKVRESESNTPLNQETKEDTPESPKSDIDEEEKDDIPDRSKQQTGFSNNSFTSYNQESIPLINSENDIVVSDLSTEAGSDAGGIIDDEATEPLDVLDDLSQAEIAGGAYKPYIYTSPVLEVEEYNGHSFLHKWAQYAPHLFVASVCSTLAVLICWLLWEAIHEDRKAEKPATTDTESHS